MSRRLFAIGGRINGRALKVLTAPGADRHEKAVAPTVRTALGPVDGTGSRLSRHGQAVIPSPQGRSRLPLVGPVAVQMTMQSERVEGPHSAPVAQLVRAGSRTRELCDAGSSPARGERRVRGMVPGEIPGRVCGPCPVETPRHATPLREPRPHWHRQPVSSAGVVARSHLSQGGES